MAISKLTGKSLDLGTDAIESFASTGIDDNATSTTLTINADGSIVVSDKVQVGGSTGNAYKIYANSNESNQLIGVFNHSAQDTGYITLSANGTTDFAQVRLGANADDMVLWTGGSESVRIDSNGKVGIGTNAPTGQLTVSAVSNHISLIESDNSDKRWDIGQNTGHLLFTEFGVADRMRITPAGIVSINEASPYESVKLHVNGNIKAGAREALYTTYDSAATWVKIYERHYVASSFAYGQHNILVTQSGSTNGHGSAARIHINTKQQGTNDNFDILYTECSGDYYTEVAYYYDATGGDSSEGLLTIWAKKAAQYTQISVTSDASGYTLNTAAGEIMAVDTASATQPTNSTLLSPSLRLHTNGTVGIGIAGTPAQKLTVNGLMSFGSTLGDIISLYDNRIGLAEMYGFGVEGSTLYSKSFAYHRWYINQNANTIDWEMELRDQGRLNLRSTTSSGPQLYFLDDSSPGLVGNIKFTGSFGNGGSYNSGLQSSGEIQYSAAGHFFADTSVVSYGIPGAWHRMNGDFRWGTYSGSTIITEAILMASSTGNLDIDGTLYQNSASTNSDQKMKENVVTLTDCLNKVSQLRGVEFDWKSEYRRDAGHDIGVIAQEVETVIPEIVTERELQVGIKGNDGETIKSVDYSKFTAVLIEAVKELKTQNEALEARIATLESS